ncbi:hypothetical protein U1Q18_019553, partial [Sarracenia purpurea var. burkii]
FRRRPMGTHDSIYSVEPPEFLAGFMDRRLDLPENLDPRASSIIRDCWQSNLQHRPSFEDLILRVTDLIQAVSASAQRSSEL